MPPSVTYRSRSTYLLYGLRVRSSVCLGSTIEGEDLGSDVVFECASTVAAPRGLPDGRVLAASPALDDFVTAIVHTGDGYVLRIRDLVDVHMSSALDRVTCELAPGVTVAHVRELVPTIFSALLSLRGETVLHGSAACALPCLAPRDGAIAFVGSSGTGKSSWAGLLCTLGARFVTDDVLPVRATGGRVTISGGGSELRLRHSAGPLIADLSNWPTRDTVDERTAVTLAAGPYAAIPIEAVILLRPDDERTTVEVKRLGALDATFALAGMQRTVGWHVPDAHRAHFPTIVSLAESVPVLVVHYARCPSQEASTTRMVLESIAKELS